MSLRVLLCCDNPIIGAGIQALLERRGLQAAVETSAARTIALTAEDPSDAVVVVSPTLTVDDTRELAQLARMGRVILLAKPENTHRALEVLRLQVRAVLSTESSIDELIHVIRTVTEVNALVIPVSARKSLESLKGQPIRPDTHPSISLTPREIEVMLLLARGNSNSRIAQELLVSEATIRSHVHHMLRKLGARTRTQAVAIAYESGLIDEIGQKASRI